MTSKRIAQTNGQRNGEKSQESGILQRAAIRSVADAEVETIEDKEAQPLNNSALSKDFSRVPVSTTKPQQIMTKLTIGAVGDKYEQEADRVAAQVVQRINAPASVRSGEDETVQREETEIKDKEARLMMSPILQCSSSDGGMAATPDLEASINRAKGGGRPMADNIRQPMEKAFGADFSGVKVHTDARSNQLNQSIQARAFTMGQNVFFRQGEYNPGSRGGQELLAHELTHVVQQNGGAVHRELDEQVKPAKIFQKKVLSPMMIQRARVANINNEQRTETEIGNDMHLLLQSLFLKSGISSKYLLETEVEIGNGRADLVAVYKEGEEIKNIFVGEIKPYSQEHIESVRGGGASQLQRYIELFQERYPDATVSKLDFWNPPTDGQAITSDGYNCFVYIKNNKDGIYYYKGRVNRQYSYPARNGSSDSEVEEPFI